MKDLIIKYSNGTTIRSFVKDDFELKTPNDMSVVSVSIVKHEHNWGDISNLTEDVWLRNDCQ